MNIDIDTNTDTDMDKDTDMDIDMCKGLFRLSYIICTEFQCVRNYLCLNDLLIITPELLPCIILSYSVIIIR